MESIRSTPRGDWAVTEVSAKALVTPRRSMVRMSAWMPAPPDESDPAIEMTFARIELPVTVVTIYPGAKMAFRSSACWETQGHVLA